MALTPTSEMGYGPLSGASLNVNFLNRDALPDDLRWLNRFVFIHITGGRKIGYTKHRIGHYLANRLNYEFSRLIIEEVNEVRADYILICPDGVIKQRVLMLGAITLERVFPAWLPFTSA